MVGVGGREYVRGWVGRQIIHECSGYERRCEVGYEWEWVWWRGERDGWERLRRRRRICDGRRAKEVES